MYRRRGHLLGHGMAEERLEQVLTDRYKYSTVQVHYKYITSTGTR